MAQVKQHCSRCHRMTWHTVPGYICEECPVGQRGSAGGGGGWLLIGIALVALFCGALSALFLGVNFLMLIPAFIRQPWVPVSGLLFCIWLWRHDRLGGESRWVRFLIFPLLLFYVSAMVLATTGAVSEGKFDAMGRDLLMYVAPGLLAGYGLTRLIPDWQGKWWPLLVGACLAQTIGRVTILGWIYGRF